MLKIGLMTISIIILFLPLSSSAQNILNELPESVTNLFDTFSQIKINVGSIPIVESTLKTIQTTAQNPQGLTSGLTDLFESINRWFGTNIGVSLGEIIKAIGSFVVWVLELIVKLIQAGLELVR